MLVLAEVLIVHGHLIVVSGEKNLKLGKETQTELKETEKKKSHQLQSIMFRLYHSRVDVPGKFWLDSHPHIYPLEKYTV